MKVVIITGTPGTGKSRLAEILAKKLGFKRIDVNKLIESRSLCEEFDEIKKCKVVDKEKLVKALTKEMEKSKNNLVIDSHMSHYLDKRIVNLCLVAKTNLKILKERLEKRGYDEGKVRENLDVEIFDVCLTEAEEAGHTIMIVDTSHDVDEEEFIDEVKRKLNI